MIPEEILKKVKLIEIKSRDIVNNIFSGEYHSAFKGLGIEYAETREYVYGDDVRLIDWNVTAKTGKPYIKIFEEEREQSIVLMVDLSASGYFGSQESLKVDTMIELSSILSFSAIKNNDKVGLLIFSDKIEKFIPPQKGKSHVLRIIRELIYFNPKNTKTNISGALDYINKVIKKKSIVFLLSDFIDSKYLKNLKYLNKKHDLINILIKDEFECKIFDLGLSKIHDIENNLDYWLDTGNKSNQQQINKFLNEEKSKLILEFKKNNLELIDVTISLGYIDPLISFFKKRSQTSR
tara:strand:- start:57 stop:935 length:879 start_codon:yes stop_codon:yes gene_type:complete